MKVKLCLTILFALYVSIQPRILDRFNEFFVSLSERYMQSSCFHTEKFNIFLKKIDVFCKFILTFFWGKYIFLTTVAKVKRKYPFPYRTRKSSSSTPMILLTRESRKLPCFYFKRFSFFFNQ